MPSLLVWGCALLGILYQTLCCRYHTITGGVKQCTLGVVSKALLGAQGHHCPFRVPALSTGGKCVCLLLAHCPGGISAQRGGDVTGGTHTLCWCGYSGCVGAAGCLPSAWLLAAWCNSLAGDCPRGTAPCMGWERPPGGGQPASPVVETVLSRLFIPGAWACESPVLLLEMACLGKLRCQRETSVSASAHDEVFLPGTWAHFFCACLMSFVSKKSPESCGYCTLSSVNVFTQQLAPSTSFV